MRKKIYAWSVLLGFVLSLFSGLGAVVAEDGGNSGAYVKTFLISAYYSPLPCQERYATGNYEADKRLNGNGTNGADGTPVYPGMVAAPRSYAFGTKMHIPGIGNVAVHDRGGAIVASNGEPGRYDRLDIWMGYGDVGLSRALQWGKRTVDVVVYGVDANIVEEVNLLGFSEAEKIPNKCDMGTTLASEKKVDSTVSEPVKVVPAVLKEEVSVEKEVEQISGGAFFNSALAVGSKGAEVRKLQEELRAFNFYWGEVNGVYDDLTAHAVYKFQQSQGIVSAQADVGAGNFGPQTRSKMNKILSLRVYTDQLVAEATSQYQESSVVALGETVNVGSVF